MNIDMKVFDVSLDELSTYLDQNSEMFLICFGTGMVAAHCERLFDRYGFWDKVECFFDNDLSKQGGEFKIAHRTFSVYGPHKLHEKRYEKAILIILCEEAEAVFDQLEKDIKNTVKSCILFPMMNQRLISKKYMSEKEHVSEIMKEGEEKKIPALIHYCWFGREEMPEEHKRYIINWKLLHPDYEIVLWNEDNYNVTKCLYMREAYRNEYYAFVSDYARLDVVYQYGGFYLDTDIELFKGLDTLRKYQMVMTYGKWPAVSSGCGLGAVAGHPLIKEMRDNPRSSISFLDDRGRPKKITNCFFESAVLEKRGFFLDYTSQNRGGVQILSPYYFPSKPLWESGLADRELIFGVHHDQGSWRRNKEKDTGE